MIKKLVWGSLFIGLVGLLIFGAVNRTTAKNGTPLAQGLTKETQPTNPLGSELSGDNNRNGAGNGQKRASGVEAILQGDCDGQGGAGNRKNQELNEGSQQGWGSGSGRGNNQGDFLGANEGGTGKGRFKGENNADGNEYGLSAIRSINGIITSVTPEAMVVSTEDEGEIVVEGRAWRFALENGYIFQENEAVSLSGFDEDGEFKAVEIYIISSGEKFQFRETTGRPMWSGQGQGSGRYQSGQDV